MYRRTRQCAREFQPREYVYLCICEAHDFFDLCICEAHDFFVYLCICEAHDCLVYVRIKQCAREFQPREYVYLCLVYVRHMISCIGFFLYM